MKYLAALAILSGCYYYYPDHVPKLNGALVVEGEQMELVAHTSQEYAKCYDSDYEHNKCEFVHGKLKRPYTLYHASVRYAGRELTQAEFMELAMPGYPDRIKGIEDRAATCKISLVPSVIAVAAAATAIVVPTLFNDKFSDDQQKMICYGGAATAAGFALLSYPLGGFACSKAQDLAGNLLKDAKETEWTSSDAEDLVPLQKMVDDFNAKHGKSTALR